GGGSNPERKAHHRPAPANRPATPVLSAREAPSVRQHRTTLRDAASSIARRDLSGRRQASTSDGPPTPSPELSCLKCPHSHRSVGTPRTYTPLLGVRPSRIADSCASEHSVTEIPILRGP